MLATSSWKSLVLGVASAIEALTGLVLTAFPSWFTRLLFGAYPTQEVIVVGRVGGIALFSLGLGCWLARRESGHGALIAMLAYSLLATMYLAWVGLRSEWVGVLLWPATAVHAVLAGFLAHSLIKSQYSALRERVIGRRSA